MNVAGLIVVALGVLLIVIALRGTQAQVFPFFFGTGTSSSTSPGGTGVCAGQTCAPGSHCVAYGGLPFCVVG